MTIKRELFNSFLKRYGLISIKAKLAKYLTESRIKKIDQVLKKRIKSVEVAFESPVDIHNAMAAFRSMEALGVFNAHIIDAKFKRSKGKKTTQGAHQWINLSYYDTLSAFLDANQTVLVGASLSGSKSLNDVPLDRNICLIFGNEKYGLSTSAINSADLLYKIPTYGMSQSYNLSVSCAISLYEILKRKRDYLKADGDLFDLELEHEKAWYYFLSLGMDLSEKILMHEN